jgi:hypothetical protein
MIWLERILKYKFIRQYSKMRMVQRIVLDWGQKVQKFYLQIISISILSLFLIMGVFFCLN